MSKESFDRLTGPAGDLTPSRYVGLKIQYFFPFSLALPTFFLLTKLVRVDILPLSLADAIVLALTCVWPVLQAQYDAIKTLASPHDAANYALFFMFLFIFSAVILWNVFTDYLKVKKVMNNTSLGDLIVILLGSFGSGYAALFDRVKNNPKPIWNFYVDSFGLYHFRQYMLFMCACMTFLILLISTAKVLDRLRS